MSSTWILDELSQAVASHRFDLEKHTFQTEDLTHVAGIALGHLFLPDRWHICTKRIT